MKIYSSKMASVASDIRGENYQLARLLATEIIEEKPFCGISESAMEKARAAMKRCDRVIYAGADIGTYNKEILDLVEEARKEGKLEEY